MVGGFEPVAKPWVAPSEIPYPFEFQLLDEDWEHFSILMESALKRIPALEQTGIRKFYNGPESFTPDNQFLLGEAPGLAGYFVGAGFNSVGIASAGGAGRALAEWVVQGEPSMDLTSVDVRRFSPYAADETWLRSRVAEILGLHYAVPWPNREPETARDVRLSPLHERVAAAGATFGTRNGWERPLYFGPALDYGWGKPAWLEHSAAEQVACRTAVAVFDQTSFSKYAVRGRDALATLQWVCAADVDVAVGQAVYTPWLNARGAYESDVTVDQGRRRGVPRGVERRDDRARPGLARRARGRGRRGRGRRPVRRPRRARRDGPAFARAAGPADRRGPRRRGVPVRHQPGARPGRCARAGDPDDVRRRARLGAPRPERRGGRRLRRAARARRRPRAGRRGVLRDRVAAPREGLPGLRPRAHPGLHAGRGRARLRDGAVGHQGLPRPRGAGRPAGAAASPRPAPAARLVRRRRPRRDALGRGAGAARRRAGRPGHQRGVRRHGRRERRSRVPAARRAGHVRLAGRGRVRGGPRRGSASPSPPPSRRRCRGSPVHSSGRNGSATTQTHGTTPASAGCLDGPRCPAGPRRRSPSSRRTTPR